jgi:hypothetical protein
VSTYQKKWTLKKSNFLWGSCCTMYPNTQLQFSNYTCSLVISVQLKVNVQFALTSFLIQVLQLTTKKKHSFFLGNHLTFLDLEIPHACQVSARYLILYRMDILICIQVYVNQSTVNLFRGWTNGQNLWSAPYIKRNEKK